jgi:signal transduction histidine kinase
VAALITTAVVEGVLRQDLRSPVFSTVIVAGLAPTLLWRRSRPLLMVAIGFGVCGLAPFVTGHEPEHNSLVYLLLLPFSLFRWGSGREAVFGAGIVVLKLVTSTVFGYMSLGEFGGGFVVLFAATALAAALRYRAKARTRELDQVKLLERERLARDLHDTVAHHVSAMAIRAEAGLAAAEHEPKAATDALDVIGAEASRALAEMRAMVRVLRQSADTAPTPGVSDLENLTAALPGPPVDVEISGDVADLPPSVGAAIYRLAQESVTNARRHAHRATRIEVRVTAGDDAVHLCVSDDGDAGPASSQGHGLIGMKERASLLGGTFEAGPNPIRGWTVTATLPRTGTRA